ncbi:TPA: acylphosphatase, partial [Candidatus Bathyarchaeota archaeon]|nr:acylphosphatase [Candidatus Bathyarchaeota archaeon]
MYNRNKVANLEARLLKVIGKVQRVGFRRYALDLAQELGLAGNARNLSDGSVQIFVQGREEELSKFIELLKSPSLGKVREIKVEKVPIDPNIKEFRIIYGELGEELQEGFGAMQAAFMKYWNEFREFREEF